jgi:CelD/BcsL family acetyltransferase involved in cellulose biosynthesis
MPVLRSIQQLEALRDDWNGLADGHGHALLRHEWIASAACTLHAAHELAVVVERDAGGRLVGAAPLVCPDGRKGGRLEVVGGAALHEPSGFVHADGAAAARLGDSVFALGRPLLLQRIVPGTVPGVGRGRQTGARGMVFGRKGAPCLAVGLAGKGPGFLEHLPGRLRSDIRRARTRAAAFGAVSSEMLAPRPDEVERRFDEFLAVESAGWKGRRGSALAMNGTLRSFFREYCRREAANGALRMSFLRIDGAAVAAQIASERYGKLWVLKIGYDERVGRCSPGLILTVESIRYALDAGLGSYEFLGGVEAWEERWAPEVREHQQVIFYPWTVAGWRRASADVASAVWRKVGRKTAGHPAADAERHPQPAETTV